MNDQPRQPAGTPTGGQYATASRGEPAVRLGDRPELRRDVTEAVTSRILPAVRAILEMDLAGTPAPVDGWDAAVKSAVGAVLELLSPDGDRPDLRGADGKVTIFGANPNGPGHGDLVFSEPDLPTTARAVLSHYISPAVGMARFDARDGVDVDWGRLEARCTAAADVLVAALTRTAR